jgi:sugar lactone lactonase YvrE
MKKLHLFPSLFLIALASHAAGKTIPNNAAADLVLGQPGFITNALLIPSGSSLDGPSGIAIDPMSQKVFITDEGNNRVLRYASALSLANGASAEAVFGQPRFSSNSFNSPTAELGMSSPEGLFFDRKGRLWITDVSNHRVLMYEAASFRGSQPFPDVVLGQPDFTTISPGTTATKMNTPQSVFVDSSDRLWVSESGNNRVLRFDDVSNKSSGASANGVLGQVNFTTFTSGTTDSKLVSPRGITVSSTGALFVADRGNNRVIRFDNAAAKPNGDPANVVLGQANFTTIGVAALPTGMDSASGVTITPENVLWVSDEDNNRILRFDNATTLTSGAAANGVIGQPNLTSNPSGLTDRMLKDAEYNPFVDGAGSLWVPDNANNRVLRFPADVTLPLLTVTTVVPKTTKAKKLTLNGTASDANGVTLVQFKVNAGPLQTATGTTTWQIKPALKKGKNTITLFATDTVGNLSVSTVLKTKRK